MKKLLLFLLIMFMPILTFAEELKLEWQKSWGGNSWDDSSSMILTSDGGYLINGWTNSQDIEGISSDSEMYKFFTKYDKNGNVQWEHGWPGHDMEDFYNVIMTDEGEFIIYGGLYSTEVEGLINKGDSDGIIVKINKDGEILWKKNWGGSDEEYFEGIIITPNNEIIAYGRSNSTDIEGLPNKGSYDAIIVKYDKDGNLIWQKNWGGNDWDEFKKIYKTSDKGYVGFISSKSTDISGVINKGENDFILIQYDNEFNILFQKSWGGNDKDYISLIYQRPDGSYILSGRTYSTNIEGISNKGKDDVIILKYDKELNLVYQQIWGGVGNESSYGIYFTSDGGFISYGESMSSSLNGIQNKGYRDAVIAKYDKDGNLQWLKTYGANKNDYFKKIIELQDGGYITLIESESENITGINNTDKDTYIIAKYNENGNILWQKEIGGNGGEYFNDILPYQEDGFIVSGHSESTNIDMLENKGESDIIIIKYDKDGNVIDKVSWGGSAEEYFVDMHLVENSLIITGTTYSTDIDGILNKGESDVIITKYSISYQLESIASENGMFKMSQQGSKGIVAPTPDKGYEVDQIIIKDSEGNILDIETTKLEDGTYSFPLYTDVSVEVIFKEKVDNPKTGLLNYGAILSLFMLLPILALVYICRYNQKYGL